MNKNTIITSLLIINFLGLIFLFFMMMKKSKNFEEITVERINVIESDGTRSLILANSERLPGSIIGDHRGPSRETPGILFYNSKGNESGGLIFDSKKNDSLFYSYQHLSFDQYDDDQVLVLSNYQFSDFHRKGLMINQLPYDQNLYDFFEAIDSIMTENPDMDRETARLRVVRNNFAIGKGMRERLFIGSENESSLLRLSDENGSIRIKISVDDADNGASIIFYDENGEVTNQIDG